MSDLAQSILGLLIPFSALMIGDLAREAFDKKRNTHGIFRVFESFVIGMSILIITLMISAILNFLGTALFFFTAVSFIFLIFWGFRMWNSRRELTFSIRKLGLMKVLACSAFCIYVGRIFLVLATRPIHDGDALYDYLSIGKVFFVQNGIGSFDPYHFWKYTNQPAIGLLNSWSFFLGNSINTEVFRMIPLLAFVLLPLVVFAISKEVFGNDTVAYVAMFLSLFVPAVDSLLYFYAFYPDLFAILFSGLSFLFIRKVSNSAHRTEAFAGLSIGLSLLFKYSVGIFTLFFCMLLWFGRFCSSKKLKYAFAGTLSGALIIAGQIQYGFFSNLWTLLTVFLCMFFVLVPLRGESIYGTSKLRLSSLPVMILFASPSLIWGVRSLLLGSSMFGVPFLRLAPINSEALTTFAYSSGASFGPLSLLTPFLHPWFNVLFFPISIAGFAFCLIKNKAQEIVFLFFFYLLFYFTLLAHYMSGRHLFIEVLFLLPMVAYFLTEVGNRIGRKVMHLLVSFYCISSLLGWVTLSFIPERNPNTDPFFAAIGLMKYSGSYSNEFSLGFFLQKAGILYVVLLAILVVIIILNRKSIRISKPIARKFGSYHTQVQKANRLGLTMLFVSLVLLVQLSPYLTLSLLDTNGDLFAFDYAGSYVKSDMDAARLVLNYVSKDEAVITYADVALSYNLIRVLDLTRGNHDYLNNLVLGCEEDQIVKTLVKNNFTYCLFPGMRHYLYADFQEFVASSSVLQSLTSSGWLIPVENFNQVWILYKLVDYTKLTRLLVENFDQSDPKFSVLKSSLNISDNLYVDNSTAFSPSRSVRIELDGTAGSRGFKIGLASPLSLKNDWFISFRVRRDGNNLPMDVMLWESDVRVLRAPIPSATTSNWTIFVLCKSYFRNMTEFSQATYNITDVEFYFNIPSSSNGAVTNVDDITLWVDLSSGSST